MDHVHICVGSNRRFIARCRRAGERKFSWIGPVRRKGETALQDMTRQWNKNPGLYFKGDVIMVADYYDPVSIVVLSRC